MAPSFGSLHAAIFIDVLLSSHLNSDQGSHWEIKLYFLHFPPPCTVVLNCEPTDMLYQSTLELFITPTRRCDDYLFLLAVDNHHCMGRWSVDRAHLTVALNHPLGPTSFRKGCTRLRQPPQKQLQHAS